MFLPSFVLKIFKFKYDMFFIRHSGSIFKFEWFEQPWFCFFWKKYLSCFRHGPFGDLCKLNQKWKCLEILGFFFFRITGSQSKSLILIESPNIFYCKPTKKLKFFHKIGKKSDTKKFTVQKKNHPLKLKLYHVKNIKQRNVSIVKLSFLCI